MKTFFIIPFLAVFAPSIAWCAHEGCTCGMTAVGAGVPGPGETAAPARHPLKGVIVGVMTDESALLIKHEEIPGVMKAMTMLLKVDEAALKSVKKGDAVTGMLVRKADGWWLEEVKAGGG
ncbi:MAG: copper-binding protein CusF [Rariglobus sp.]|jgi:Cu/Ag efflux protein CusF|nr:copper-binding protein CusF [Rariglobus sp.]